MPAANWAVVPAADWYGTVPAEPPAKLPEASRATRVEAVFALVALVASVTAVEPL